MVHLFLLDRFLGGNQREQDRLKAQKKAAAQQKKPKESATNLVKRKEAYVSRLLFEIRAPNRVIFLGMLRSCEPNNRSEHLF